MAKSKAQSQAEELGKAFDLVASTREGQAVLNYIYAISGYGDPSLVRLDGHGKVDPEGSLYNLSKRDLWVHIRGQINPELLPLIEKEIRHE